MSFEQAVDAIIEGDRTRLAQLLSDQPGLVQERSERQHRSMLLHYVSANGVEVERQKTPPNIVEMARLLLDAGADVNSKSEAYGGGSTTLTLTATSVHPEVAGVQPALMQLLISRGATIPPKIVNNCLHNGRGLGARLLAEHGAPLDFEAAAGLGLLQLVHQLFPTAPKTQLIDGFCWACEFGHLPVVEFMVKKRPALVTSRRDNNQTGLHWASYFDHQKIVKLLLDQGADPNVKEDVWGGTPADWAEHGRRNPPGR